MQEETSYKISHLGNIITAILYRIRISVPPQGLPYSGFSALISVIYFPTDRSRLVFTSPSECCPQRSIGDSQALGYAALPHTS